MFILPLGLFALSLTALIFSSNKFIGSSETIGYSLGISPFVIGVTIIAFGTSIPELSTSIFAVIGGTPEVVIGNVVGSNITNILLILGVSTLAAGTLKIEKNIFDEDFSMLVGSSFLLWFVCRDGHFSIIEAIILLSGLSGFIWYSMQSKDLSEFIPSTKASVIEYVILAISGVAIFYSAKFTIQYLTELATILKVSPSLVSVTLLALGTSLPELVVGVMAARKGKHAIALGSVMGSNIFNTYAVMAIPSFFGPLAFPPEIIAFALPFMVVVTILFGVITYSRQISFWKAGMLISFYIFFVAELIRLGVVN